MKVILRDTINGLGEAGDIKNVKDGFGRNYLIPQGLAYHATKGYLKIYDQEKTNREKREGREIAKAQKLAAKLSNLSLEATVQVGEDDKVFGAVTSANIAELLAVKGHDIDKRNILLDEPLNALGIYNVAIKISSTIKAEVKVWVIKE